MHYKALIFLLLLPLMTVADELQEVSDAARKANPCLYDEQFKEFDFWIGEWDVHVANGTLAGHNEITREQRGCVLIENWASVSGGGGVTEEGMLLVGTIHYVATEQTLPFRGLWTLLEDGRVRQFFEQSNDSGATWVPWFEGFYTRVDMQYQE